MQLISLFTAYLLLTTSLPAPAQTVRAVAVPVGAAPKPVPAAPRRGTGPEYGTVRRVLDADTYEVLLPAGLVRVRLPGVDAPELSQPFGKQAADSVARLLIGRVLEVERLGQDSYGRTLTSLRVGMSAGPLAGPFRRRWLRLDSLVVVRGWAWAYEPGQAVPALAGLQELAQRQRRGLWRCGAAKVVRPGIWRAFNKQEKASAWRGCAW
ncbi:thermonuclease family protein [Hymenobacter rubripertinctus]|uniref:TNase-like domain-containing protein n=1 Tax=Hymenobacter rubripertinctus TaxID=2029981 RepID=A0A418R940_9BACT|nr:thermonuclease family protein [Hymenobacter rubripertinctus]RIY13772.1 hypothetical protein D0T11_01445 [Hymenobacter rubripertinctus]